METKQQNLFYEQFVPLGLAIVVLAGLSALVWITVAALNNLLTTDKISTALRWSDIAVGATIYLKTSADFAIFIGQLMSANPGWKNRVAIEIGTALGNALGTILILIVWVFFRQVEWLLALMMLVAALVLLELAYAGLEHFTEWEGQPGIKRSGYIVLQRLLSAILKYTRPVTSKILPDFGSKLKSDANLPWRPLLAFSFTIPFLLGLDDFAGYVPLFSVINVLGFSIGVLAAHTALNAALFLNPKRTSAAVRNQWVSFLGTLAFAGLALLGIIEAIKIFI